MNQRPNSIPAPASRIRLADIDPDLLRGLEEEDEEEEARRHLALLVVDVPEGPIDLEAHLTRARAVAAVVVQGMLQHYARIAEQMSLRLLGPGEIAACGSMPRSGLVSSSEWRASAATRLAFLDQGFQAANRRWPGLYAGVQSRMADQAERLAAQMTICQLPRVEDRLLSLLWLLAESWGHVTPVGTTLPLSLTHEALGAMIGARRPTVTLALGELVDRGALVRQDRGWLLIEAPRPVEGRRTEIEPPRVLEDGASAWMAPPAAGNKPPPELRAELSATVSRLREQHHRTREELEDRLQRCRVVRAQAEQARARARGRYRIRDPRPPSS